MMKTTYTIDDLHIGDYIKMLPLPGEQCLSVNGETERVDLSETDIWWKITRIQGPYITLVYKSWTSRRHTNNVVYELNEGWNLFRPAVYDGIYKEEEQC